MHTVSYDCDVDVRLYPHLTIQSFKRLEYELEREGFRFYMADDYNILRIIGSIWCSNDVTPEEISAEIYYILTSFDIDVTQVHAEEEFD